MNIARGQVMVASPGRNFVTLRLETEDGLHGVGDATLNGRELAVATYLQEHLLPVLKGRDARAIEDTWQYLYKGAYWRRGPVTMAAIAAVDMALWDLAGKRLGVPVHELLGGRSREGVLVYGHASGRSIEETIESVHGLAAQGYRAIRAQCGVPGLEQVYGVGTRAATHGPADGPVPDEHRWSTERYLDVVPRLFEQLREDVGFDVHLLHDAHHRLTPTEAGWLGQRLEPYRLFWLEDAVPAENQDLFRQLRAHTTTPLAVGEVFNSIFDLHTIVTERLVDYIRCAAVHAGGITQLRKIAHFMEPYQIRLGSHGPTDISPVGMAAGLQVDLTINNFGIQEFMPHSEQTYAMFPHTYRFRDGYLDPGDEPGLGIDIDLEIAEQFPYERAYLPVNRGLDGTLLSW